MDLPRGLFICEFEFHHTPLSLQVRYRLRQLLPCRFHRSCLDSPFESFLLLALLAVGIAIPTPAGIGGFHWACRIGLVYLFARELGEVHADPADWPDFATVDAHLIETQKKVRETFLKILEDAAKP